MTRSYEPHRALEQYSNAARAVGLPARTVSFTDLEAGLFGRIPVAARNLLNPWRCASLLRAGRAAGELVIVRDFLSVPLALAVPVLRSYRDSTLFVMAHNVQAARKRFRDRWALRHLARCGFQFVIPESAAGLDEIGLACVALRGVVLPLVSPLWNEADERPRMSELVIGVIGRPRADKGEGVSLSELEAVAKSAGLHARFLVGRPGVDSGNSTEEIEFIDTSTSTGYRRALSRTSILVIHYSHSEYSHRPSATIADAIAAGCVVVCPDYPVFRAQVLNPASAGELYQARSSLGDALLRAAGRRESQQRAVEEHRVYRSLESVGTLLRDFIRNVVA